MKNIMLFFLVFIITIVSFIYVGNRAVFSYFETKTGFEELQYSFDGYSFDVFVNQDFSYHNTSERKEKIEYIVIHYTGTTSEAEDIINSYNSLNHISSSADFFVSHKGIVYQYNPNIDERYTWAVGGDKKDNLGGSYYDVVNNENSVSIEMCVKNNGMLYANSKDWYFTDETINSSVLLVSYLMKEYDIDKTHVIRHYDVSGKECPGVYGWNEDTGSTDSWNDFLKSIY